MKGGKKKWKTEDVAADAADSVEIAAGLSSFLLSFAVVAEMASVADAEDAANHTCMTN